jgi:hypothetical protein
VTVTRVEKFVEPAPEPPEPDAPLADYVEMPPMCEECNDEGCDLCEPGLEIIERAPKSELEIVVEEAASDPAHKLIVHLLVNYDIDRRTDKAAELAYCTTLQPVTIDYLAMVAKHFGAGVYLFELYEPGRGITKRWHKKIKGAVVEPPPALTPQVVEPSIKGTVRTELKRLRDVAEELSDLRHLMGWDVQQTGAPAAPAAPAAPEVDPLDRLLLKAALDKPELSDRILERVLPASDTGGGGLGGLIAEAMKHPKEARELIQELAGAVRSAFAPLHGNGSGQGAPDASASPASSAPTTSAEDLERTLNVVVEDLKKNKRVGRAADAIDELMSKRPDLIEMFDKLLALEPAAMLAEFSQHANENLHEYGHALSFVINLRDALRPAVEEFSEGES